MILTSETNQSFGQMHFGNAQLGDKRRTKRLVACADALCRHPGGTLPDKFHAPADLKAFYRLCNSSDVNHQTVLAPHRERTLNIIEQLGRSVLIIHDATELDYTCHHSLSELGQIGNGNQRGYICQNSLAVDAQSREVLGLTNQVLHRRVRTPQGETMAQKRRRATRESRLWLHGVKGLPANRQIIDVCDQGADTFEFLEHESRSGRRFVIRAAYDRGIWIGHDDPAYCRSGNLRKYARRLPSLGERTVKVTSKMVTKSPKKRGKKKNARRKAREATLRVSAAPIQVIAPASKNGEHGNAPLLMWIVRVWEVNPPRGEDRLEWFLLTNEPVETFTDACRVIGWYECRWIVEEYHKALKTGCGIENPQFTKEDRLQPAIALISVIALTLLSLRDASRQPDAKKRLATELISQDYVKVLSLWRHKQTKNDWTVHEFFYALARLGGHQNRRNDKRPGWLILWRGWTKLQLMLEGMQAANLLKRCG